MGKSFKRFMALFIAGVMLVSTGCTSEPKKETSNNKDVKKEDTSNGNNASKDDEGNTTPVENEEPVTITVFHSNIGTLPSNILDNPVMQEIEKRLGIILDFTPFNGGNQEDANQRLSTLIASGDIPDLIINTDQNINQILLKNNMLEPLDSLVDQYGADLLANVKEGLDFSKLMYSQGQEDLYFIPGLIGDESFYPMGYDLIFQIRGDLLYDMGKTELNSLDELLEYAKKAQELEPTTASGKKTYMAAIPFADTSGWDYVDWNISHNDGLAAVGGFNYLDLEKNELVPRFTDPNNTFWKAMKFWNTAYREDLLDPESATMKFQQVQDRGKALRYFVGLANWQIGWPNDVIRGLGEDSPKGFIPTLLDSKENHNFFRFSSPVGNTMLWSISKNSEHKEKVIQFINFCASWEGIELMWNGPEGTFWQMTDGIPKPVAVDPDAPSDPDATKKVGNAYMAPNFIINGKTVNAEKGWKVKYGDNAPENYQQYMTEPEKKFIEMNDFAYPTQIFESREHYSANTSIIDSVKADPNSDIAAIEQSIKIYLDTNIARIVYAEDDASFTAAKDRFIDDLKKLEIEKVMEFYKAGFDENMQKLEKLK